MHLKIFPDGDRLYFFDNGYAASRVCNMFSYGVEVLVFQWDFREPTFWEKIKEKLGLVEEYERRPFYYDRVRDVKEDLVGLDNWNEDMGVYTYLNPDQEKQLMDGLKQLKKKETTK